LPGNYGDDAGRRARGVRVDARDPRVGVGRAHEHEGQLAGQVNVFDVAPLASDQALVFDARTGESDLARRGGVLGGRHLRMLLPGLGPHAGVGRAALVYARSAGRGRGSRLFAAHGAAYSGTTYRDGGPTMRQAIVDLDLRGLEPAEQQRRVLEACTAARAG